MTKRYVDVPAERLLGELRAIGRAVEQAGGRAAEGALGGEHIVQYWPARSRGWVRVLTTVAVRGATRGCGEDAIRIMVLVAGSPTVRVRHARESWQVVPYDRVLRTAPSADADRVETFLARLRARVRVAVGIAMDVPGCPDCGTAMVQRNGSFWGCVRYPDCRGTRGLKPPRDARGHRTQE